MKSAKARMREVFNPALSIFNEHLNSQSPVPSIGYPIYSSYLIHGPGGSGKTNALYYALAERTLSGEKMEVYAVSKDFRPELYYLTKGFGGKYASGKESFAIIESVERVINDRRKIMEKANWSSYEACCELLNKAFTRIVFVAEEIDTVEEIWLKFKDLLRTAIPSVGVQVICITKSPTALPILNHQFAVEIFMGPLAPNTARCIEARKNYEARPELLQIKRFEGMVFRWNNEGVVVDNYNPPNMNYPDYVKAVESRR